MKLLTLLESDLPRVESLFSNEAGRRSKGADENMDVSYEQQVLAFIRKNQDRVRDIYEIYFNPKSPYQINVENKVTQRIKKFMETPTEEFQPNPKLFNSAQKSVFV